MKDSTWATPLPSARSDRARALLLPALLLTVAVIGIQRSAALDQSSWQGASFGMFATYDNDTSRTVVVTATGPDGSFPAAIPSTLSGDATRLRVVPTDAGATNLAREVVRLGSEEGVTEVVVRVLRIRLSSGDGLHLRVELIAAGAAEA